MKAPRPVILALAIAVSIGLASAAAVLDRSPSARAARPTAGSGTKPVGTRGRVVQPPAALPAETPAAPEPYHVAQGEVHADAKQLASEIALRLTTYPAGATLADIVGDPVFAGTKGQPALLEAARVLHHPTSWSRGTVVYPQLGGMRPDRASVMVVVRQKIGVGIEPSTTETRTLDVRLERHEGSWVFDELASAGGTRVARPAALPSEAVAVLDNPRIEIPDSARWDIYRGRVAPTLLRLMARIAERTSFGVVVLESGHPINVFATSHRSAHTTGHAVDIYRLGDARVVDDRGSEGNANTLARWLYGQSEVAQIGSPWALDGRGGRSFTDVVHQDHIHVAVGR